ncbi:MAG: hypothetical protein LWY06_15640 [Firmicutes bacterium]|nr:hypothetical protein [Bacillota bacterium]
MKNRMWIFLACFLVLPEVVFAQGMADLQKYHNYFLYAFIGLSVLLAALVLWEVMYLSSKGKSEAAQMKVNIIGETDKSDEEQEDPIKALLKSQSSSSASSPQPEEDSLPSFLKLASESSGDDEDSSQFQAPPPPVRRSIDIAPPSQETDPFKMLLAKNTEESEPEPEPEPMPVQEKPAPVQPVQVAPPVQAPVKIEPAPQTEKDPFMELLKASKSEVNPAVFDDDASKTPSELLRRKQYAADPDSGIKVQLEKPLQQPDEEKKRITLSPPKPTIQKEKRISFDLGGSKMKPKSSGKLFSKISGDKEDSEGDMFKSGDDLPAAAPTKLSLSPETLEKAIELDSGSKEISLREPEPGKVVLKKPGEPGAPEKGKPMLELKIKSGEGGKPMVNRPAEIKKPTVKMPSKPVGLAKPPDITVPTRILMDARSKQTANLPPVDTKPGSLESPGQSKVEGGDISGSSQG